MLYTSVRSMEKDLTIGILNEIYGALLTDNQRDMIRSYYDCDLSLGEIAEYCGISRQAVRDSVAKGREALLEYERRLGTKDKLDRLKSSLEECLCEKELDVLRQKIGEVIKSI